MSQFFIHEQPIVVLPSLVGVVGFARAVILQQIHYTTNQPRSGVTLDDGYKWVWNSYKQWREDYLPFLSERQIQRHIIELEEKGFLLSCQAEKSNWDRTKYYRINYDLFVVNSKYLALKNESADDDENVPMDNDIKATMDSDTLGTIEGVRNERFFLTNSSSNSSTKESVNDLVKEIFNFWVLTMKKRSDTKLDPQRKKKIQDRLKDGYSIERIKNAIIGCSISPHHQGQNNTFTVYNDIELICRSPSKLEFFEQIAATQTKSSLSQEEIDGRAAVRASMEALNGR